MRCERALKVTGRRSKDKVLCLTQYSGTAVLPYVVLGICCLSSCPFVFLWDLPCFTNDSQRTVHRSKLLMAKRRLAKLPLSAFEVGNRGGTALGKAKKKKKKRSLELVRGSILNTWYVG